MADDDKKVDTPPVDRGDEVVSPLDTAGKLPPEPEAKKAPVEDDAAKGDKLDLDKEGDETPEEKAEREKQEAEEAKKRNIRIPKSRFDEAQAKAKQREQALLAEIERLQGGKQASSTQETVQGMKAKIEELQDKYEDLILDGKKDEARQVRKQVNEMREHLTNFQASAQSEAVRKSAIEELTYNAKLANYEAQYPALNPDHEDFDAEKTDEAVTLLNALVKSGTKRDVALDKAVKYVMGSPPEQKVSDAAKVLAEKRAQEARKKAADADKKQPPSTAKVGIDSDKAGKASEGNIDVMRLSQANFAKLDEDTKSKLRGDEV